MAHNIPKFELDCGNSFDYIYKIPQQKDRMLAMKNETIGFLAAMERERQLKTVATSIDFLMNGKDSEYETVFDMPKVTIGTQEVNVASSFSSRSSSSSAPSDTDSSTSVEEEEEEKQVKIWDETLVRQYVSVELMETIQGDINAAAGVTITQPTPEFLYFIQYIKEYIAKAE